MALGATRRDRTGGAGTSPRLRLQGLMGPKISLKISIRFLLT